MRDLGDQFRNQRRDGATRVLPDPLHRKRRVPAKDNHQGKRLPTTGKCADKSAMLPSVTFS